MQAQFVALIIFPDIAEYLFTQLVVIGLQGAVQFPAGQCADLRQPGEEFFAGVEGVQPGVSEGNLFLQVFRLDIQLVQEFQQSAQQIVGTDEDEVLCLVFVKKLRREFFDPDVHSRIILLADQPDQFFFPGIGKGFQRKVLAESLPGIKYIFLRKEEAVFQCMIGAFVGKVHAPEVGDNIADADI